MHSLKERAHHEAAVATGVICKLAAAAHGCEDAHPALHSFTPALHVQSAERCH